MPDRTSSSCSPCLPCRAYRGSIYESVWSHYLKLFLGAGGVRPSFVLAAFMAEWPSGRGREPLERATEDCSPPTAGSSCNRGAALIFHESFLLLTQFLLDQSCRRSVAGGGRDLQVSLLPVLIVPQTLLLGMLSRYLGAVIRRGPEAERPSSGDCLYFTNSIGAAAGGARGRVPAHRLARNGRARCASLGRSPRARRGGSRHCSPRRALPPSPRHPRAARRRPGARWSACFSQRLRHRSRSFIYGSSWIRMLSLVLGASFDASS